MVDGSRGEAISRAEIVSALARSVKAGPLMAMAADIDEVDVARGNEYALLSALLACAPDRRDGPLAPNRPDCAPASTRTRSDTRDSRR